MSVANFEFREDADGTARWTAERFRVTLYEDHHHSYDAEALNPDTGQWEDIGTNKIMAIFDNEPGDHDPVIVEMLRSLWEYLDRKEGFR